MARWDFARYPEAVPYIEKGISYPVKLKINSEVPINRELCVTLELKISHKENNRETGGSVTVPSIWQAGQTSDEIEINVPDIGRSEYIIEYNIYEKSDSSTWYWCKATKDFTSTAYSRNGYTYLVDTLPADLKPLLEPNAELCVTLLKQRTLMQSYKTVDLQKNVKGIIGEDFTLYVRQSFPQPGGSSYNYYGVYNIFRLTVWRYPT